MAIRGLSAWAIVLLAAGCGGPERDAAAAERQYQLVAATDPGDWEKRCEAGRRVAAAWLQAENSDRCALADIKADLDCNHAAMEKGGP